MSLYVFVEIQNAPNKNIIVGCLYRPPNSNVSTFNETIGDLLKLLNYKKLPVYILGDFNIDLLKYNTHNPTSEFVNTIFSESFIPLINRPTRVTETSATLIDNILTNQHDVISLNGIIPTDISDHFSVFHVHNCEITNYIDNDSKYNKYLINDKTLHNFNELLKQKSWHNVLECCDPNEAYKKFNNIMQDTLSSTIPLQNYKINNKLMSKPWLTNELIESIKLKNKMYKAYKVDGNKTIEKQFKTFKNKLTNDIRNADKLYYKTLLDRNKNNLAKQWKTLNSIINRKKSEMNNIVFKHNNRSFSSPNEIVEQFSTYFQNAGKTLSNSIKRTTLDPCSYMPKSINETIFLSPTSQDELLKIISDMKNTTAGHDNINMRIIKSSKYYLLSPLLHICNICLSSGIFPDDLKIAKIIPIYKKGDKDTFSNYRPISILPALSKVLEKLLYKRLVSFLDKHKILFDNQFGFRKGLSTEMAIHTLTEKYYEAMDNNDFMVGIFLDFSRAFDTISHKILLRKLIYYGIRGTAFGLLKSYLEGRKQYVCYNACASGHVEIDIGIPQGSILGPLLFILYVNEFCNVSPSSTFIQFADDTNIFTTGSSLENIFNKLNRELLVVDEWIRANNLVLNVSKSTYMIMCSPRRKYNADKLALYIAKLEIIKVEQTKFLGVILDSRLNWKPHIDYICNKISKGIGILKRIRELVYTDTLMTVYNSLIKPHFTYCITVWGGSYISNINRVSLLHKKIIRILTRSIHLEHTAPLYNKLSILNVYEMHIYYVAIHIYKIIHKLSPFHWCSIFNQMLSRRNSQNLCITLFKRKCSQFSLKVVGPKIWNTLSNNLKLSKSFTMFKKILFQDLLNK